MSNENISKAQETLNLVDELLKDFDLETSEEKISPEGKVLYELTKVFSRINIEE